MMEPIKPPLCCLVLDFFLHGDLPHNEWHTVWHGALGNTLSHVAPSLFTLLYGEGENSTRLYSLVPPLPNYPRLRVTLLGDACHAGLDITEIIKAMGRQGLRGQDRHRFTIDWAQYGSSDPMPYYYGQVDEMIGAPEAHRITREFFNYDMGQRNNLRFSTITPLILKEDNGVMAGPPSFSGLVRRLLGRISQVAHATGAALPYDDGQQRDWERQSASVVLVNQKVKKMSFSRQSKRTEQPMAFSGWEGVLDYAGPVGAFYSLFKLGENLQLGGCTAFGFGAFQTFWGKLRLEGRGTDPVWSSSSVQC